MLERGEVRASEVSLRGAKASSDEFSVDVSDGIIEEARRFADRFDGASAGRFSARSSPRSNRSDL